MDHLIHQEWLQHPQTQALLKTLKARVEQSYQAAIANSDTDRKTALKLKLRHHKTLKEILELCLKPPTSQQPTP